MRRLAFLLLASAVAASAADATPVPVDPRIRVRLVTAALGDPGGLVSLPNGRLLVSERTSGTIYLLFADTTLAPVPLADVPVNACGERGGLGLAAARTFPATGFVYYFYTRSSTGADTDVSADVLDHRVVRFQMTGDAIDVGSETLVRSLPVSTASCASVGGSLQFGPDGSLLVSLGDGGIVPSPALDLWRLEGKLLRLDATTGQAASDNIFATDANPSTADEIWAYGFRDPVDFWNEGDRWSPPAAPSQVFVLDRVGGVDDELDEVDQTSDSGYPVVLGVPDAPPESAYVAEHSQYRTPIRVSGVGPARPTGLLRGWGLASDSFYPAVWWGEADSIGGDNSVVIGGLDTFIGRLRVSAWPYAAGFAPIRDLAWVGGDAPLGEDFMFVATSSGIWALTIPPDTSTGGTGVPPPAASGWRLALAGANPARGVLRLSALVPAGAHARFEIRDVLGRRVCGRDVPESVAGSMTTLTWDGTSAEGARAASGVYVARLATDRGEGPRAVRFVWLAP